MGGNELTEFPPVQVFTKLLKYIIISSYYNAIIARICIHKLLSATLATVIHRYSCMTCMFRYVLLACMYFFVLFAWMYACMYVCMYVLHVHFHLQSLRGLEEVYLFHNNIEVIANLGMGQHSSSLPLL